MNQPTNNSVEQNTIPETSAVSLKNTPSPKELGFPSSRVSADQSRIFDPPNQLIIKKKSIQKRGFLPSIITIDSNTHHESVVNKLPSETISENVSPKKSQFFTCKTNVETVLQGAEGTTLTIPKDCFETETGNILRGDIRIELKEFLKTSDMVLAKLVTQSDDKLLETGGMIYFNATDVEGRAVKIGTDENIKITLPKTPNSAEKQIFYGEKLDNGRINWTLPKQIEDNFNTLGYNIVDQNPEFPNGQAALFKFIEKNLVYPKTAWENNVSGTVYVSFTVNRSGLINNVQVKRGLGSGCNEEAVRVIRSMPRWKPGRSGGVKVPVSYTLPVRFQLKNNKLQIDSLVEFQKYATKDSVKLDKIFEIEDTQEYVMSTQKLGWINCDRFLNLQNTERTDFVVWHNKPYAEICLVFKNYRTIVGSWSSSEKKVQFIGIPIGQPVFIVATSPDDGKFNISVTETIISKDQSTTIELKTVKKETFIHELHRLDVFNE